MKELKQENYDASCEMASIKFSDDDAYLRSPVEIWTEEMHIPDCLSDKTRILHPYSLEVSLIEAILILKLVLHHIQISLGLLLLQRRHGTHATAGSISCHWHFAARASILNLREHQSYPSLGGSYDSAAEPVKTNTTATASIKHTDIP